MPGVDLNQPFRGSVAIADGLLTPGVLRGPRFRRLFPDVYVLAGAEVDLELLSRAAYLLVAGRGALGGGSAAQLLGCSCAPPRATRRARRPCYLGAPRCLLRSPRRAGRGRGTAPRSPASWTARPPGPDP